jgi:hypothetical protein
LKIVLSLVLSLSILINFSYAKEDPHLLDNNYDNLTSCEMQKIYENTSKPSQSQSDHKTCDCYAGHCNLATLNWAEYRVLINVEFIRNRFDSDNNNRTSNYQSEINRPPIT